MICYLDFEYDNRYLSDFGFIICHFDGSPGIETVSAGSAITFGKVSRNSGKQYSLTSTRYDECIKAEFEICKDPELCMNRDERYITNDEYRELMRWLNRREFLKFHIIGNDEDGRDTCYFNASFNIEKIKDDDKLYGLRLSMESDKPFGVGEEQRIRLDFTDTSKPQTINDKSDEIGFIYPDMKIICKEDGDILISNSYDECKMLIKNCSVGEVIEITGSPHIIRSDNRNHDIANDFNYEFFKIGNTLDDRRNIISASKECEITLIYSPIIKDIP